MERTRMEQTMLAVLIAAVLVLALQPAAAFGQEVQTNQPVQNEALAEFVLFGDDLPIARRAGFEVKLTMMVGVGDPEEPDADYEFLMQAAESGEPFPASRVETLRPAFDRAFRIESQRAAEHDDEAHKRLGRESYLSQSRSIVTSADGPGRIARTQSHDGILPPNTHAGAIVDAGVVDRNRTLAGVRIYGSETTQGEFHRVMRSVVFADHSIRPIAAASAYLRDGEAFASTARYQHQSLGLPVTVVVLVEARSIEVEDLHLVLIECNADSALARMLSAIGPDAPMIEMSEPRLELSREVLRSHIDGHLNVLLRSRGRSAGRYSAGQGPVEHMENFHRPRIDAFRFVYPEADATPELRLDLGFGDEPTRIAAPRPIRHSVIDNGVPRRIPSLNGDLRVLLSGAEGDRFRAILCLQVASFTDD